MHARIVQEIGMQIVSGRFKPDEKLPAEALLCEEYAVSRPVLREATRVLVAKGLVYSRPRVGTVVKARREWHLLDPDVLHWVMQSTPQNEFFNLLTSVRAVIEPAVAALAAQHATEEEIAGIGEAYQRMETAANPQALLQPDLDFHSRIADATHICATCSPWPCAKPSSIQTSGPTCTNWPCRDTRQSSPPSRTAMPSAPAMQRWYSWTMRVTP
jgi:DNA-binding FadR family transcriptional regulator